MHLQSTPTYSSFSGVEKLFLNILLAHIFFSYFSNFNGLRNINRLVVKILLTMFY